MNFNPPKRGEPVAPVPEEGYVLEEEFFGRPYRIWAGPKEGTFVVQYGDESFIWEPKPWHPPSLQKQGPVMYNRWTQPGLPYPWDYTMEERQTMPGTELHDRAYTSLYFSEFSINYMTHWAVDVTSPDGTPRNKELYEWLTSYRMDTSGIAEDLVGKVRCNYSFAFTAPDDFRGLGIATTIYLGEKFNDEFLYTPSSRKVRRLPQAARQDFIPGTIGRWEDFPQVKPFNDIDYVVTGTALYSGPTAGQYGTTMDSKAEQVNIGIDGIGEPAFVYELRPHSDSYWYGMQRRMIGMKSLSSWNEEAYNHQGKLFRLRTNRRGVVAEDPRMRNKEGPFIGPGGEMYHELQGWEPLWGGEYITQINSGFVMSWYMLEFWYDYPTMPRDIVNLENLRKEPVRKILFWE